jgi:hypothetical protein
MEAVITRESEHKEHKEHEHEHVAAVAVITPVGTYPDENEFRRVADAEIIENILAMAANKLKLTNTSDWVAHARGREINVKHSFRHDHLFGIVEIEWHKHEGGGGARNIGAREL